MNAIETGLYSTLTGGTALISELGATAIYSRHAPQGTARPYIIFMHAGGGHENINPSDLQNHLYLVKAVADGSKEAGTIDELVIDLLHGETLTVAGYTNIWMAREQEVQMTEPLRDGKVVYHCGGYYRIRIDD